MQGWAETHRYRIYMDADFSGARASSLAIEQGILTALDMANYQIGGVPVDFVRMDHHGNSRRSFENLKTIQSDPGALAVFCGLHSPPVVSNLDFIHEAELLFLDPWAAAESITRYSMDTNWVFRLSLDDSKVGRYLVEYAIKERGFKRPILILEDTSWGRSNEHNMLDALGELHIVPLDVQWFNWNLESVGARLRLRRSFEAEADCLLLAANTLEGAVFVREMAALPEDKKIPIISHWGITGDTFFEQVGADALSNVDLCFIQPNLSVFRHPTSFGKEVFDRANELFEHEWSSTGPSPAGFLHGYDLTRLLLAAGEQVNFSGHLAEDKEALRGALEHLENPVEGLLKVYEKPFSPMRISGRDAHEALREADYRMARFRADGAIVLEEKDED